MHTYLLVCVCEEAIGGLQVIFLYYFPFLPQGLTLSLEITISVLAWLASKF